MERALRAQRTLSKQEEIDEGDELVTFEECVIKTEVPTGNGKLSESIQPSQPSCTPSHNNNNEIVNNNNTSNSNSLHRSRSKVKLLVRSHAVREESSPPPEPIEFTDPSSPTSKDLPNAVITPSSASSRRHKFRREGSSETWDQPPPLSRGGSLREPQYDTANSAELHQFIVETLNRNQKDRMLLLKIESELLALAKDPKRTMHKFGHMSSYQRMLVHRVAAYFSMEHNVDATGVSVIVNTTKATRVPDRRFKDYIRDDLLLPEEPRRSILKRDSSSFDETGSFKSGERMLNGESRRSKSFEERTEEYEKAKRRIFNREHSADADVDCLDELGWDPDGSCACDHLSESRAPNERSVRLLKVESYESGDSLRSNSLRLSAVSKSHSFNGYENQSNTRILTKQDSGSSMSSRISPSSSGYKSQRSDATLSATPSPTATPNLHTQTGQPYTNPDGSIYHYDPSNPPRVPDHSGHLQCSSKTTPSNQLAESTALNPTNGAGPIDDKTVGEMVSYDPSTNNAFIGPPTPIIEGQTASAQGLPPLQCPPLVYPVQSYQPVPQQYDPRLSMDANAGSSDLSTYMMGLSLDGSRSNPPDPRQGNLVYWPQHQIQNQASGVPFYYTPSPGNNSNGGPRYQQSFHPHPQPPSTPAQVIPPVPPPPPLSHQPHQLQSSQDHTGGGCYGPAYPNSVPECISYAPSAVHMYYPPPYNSCGCGTSGSLQTSTSTGNPPQPYYCPTGPNVTSQPAAPVLTLQYSQSCPHPPPPHPQQNVCNQFAVYNGCYPPHYPAPPNSLSVPQLLRKPTLQVGVGMRCNSPLRPPYPASPKERPQDEKQPQAVSVYGFRVVPGDMRLLGSSGRLPFSLPAPSKQMHPRKNRSKVNVNKGPQSNMQNGHHPVLHSTSKV